MSDCHGPNVMESSAQTPNATKPMVEMKNPLKDIKGTELPEEDGPGISSELGLRVASEAHNKADALQRIRSKSFLGELSSPDGSSAEPPEAIEFTRVVIDRQSALHDPDAKIASVIIDKALALRQRWQRSFPAIDPDEHVASTLDSPAGSPRRMPHHSEAPPGNAVRRRPAPEFNPFGAEVPSRSQHVIKQVRGVYQVVASSEDDTPAYDVPSVDEFYRDMKFMTALSSPGPVTTYSYKRMQVLEERFNLHEMLNADREQMAQKSAPHRDFYNVRKVDTHVHHSACMNQKHLLRFIKAKLKRNPNEIVAFRDGRFLTLAEVFASLGMTAHDLSVDTLDMHANNTFHRFDRFNLKYNPAGQSRLREIFIKTDNLLAGQYLAEITREVISDMEASKYQLAEWRVSIYGRKLSEWDKLARWFYAHRLAHPCVRWLIQIPRLFHLYAKSGEVTNFQDMLDNIFAPMFEVTVDPSSNVELHVFLSTVVGFDCVDDESNELPESFHDSVPPLPPSEWKGPSNPPYSMWMYYLYANLAHLNHLRAERGMNCFEFRPHCGEAGDVDHLGAAFLTAHKINHGIQLRKAPGLHYLYFLAQIGIAMSPLSNNKLFLDYNKNPFRKYFAQGLNVSLSTDDPLQLHVTKEPLMEEYSVASQVWKLSAVDMCEIARNSVLQSGLEYRFKRHFLGRDFQLPGAQGNDIGQTNVPSIRLQYRAEQLMEEMCMVRDAVAASKLRK